MPDLAVRDALHPYQQQFTPPISTQLRQSWKFCESRYLSTHYGGKPVSAGRVQVPFSSSERPGSVSDDGTEWVFSQWMEIMPIHNPLPRAGARSGSR